MSADLSFVHLMRPATIAARAGDPSPLLILMHGVGSNERSLTVIADKFDPRFIVVSVRSPIELGVDSYGFFHVSFEPSGPRIVAEEAVASWKLVSTFIDEAVRAYNADAKRVYLAGFSQGGIMALATTLTSPQKVAGAVCMSGRLLPEVIPYAADRSLLEHKPIMVVHGTVDEKLGIDFARSARDLLTAMGVDLSYKEYPMRHRISRETLDDVTAWLTSQLNITENV